MERTYTQKQSLSRKRGRRKGLSSRVPRHQKRERRESSKNLRAMPRESCLSVLASFVRHFGRNKNTSGQKGRAIRDHFVPCTQMKRKQTTEKGSREEVRRGRNCFPLLLSFFPRTPRKKRFIPPKRGTRRRDSSKQHATRSDRGKTQMDSAAVHTAHPTRAFLPLRRRFLSFRRPHSPLLSLSPFPDLGFFPLSFSLPSFLCFFSPSFTQSSSRASTTASWLSDGL